MKFKNIALALLTIIAIMPAQAMWDGAIKFLDEITGKEPLAVTAIAFVPLFLTCDYHGGFKMLKKNPVGHALLQGAVAAYGGYKIWKFYQNKLNEPLFDAIKYAHLEKIKCFVRHGVDLNLKNIDGETAYAYAFKLALKLVLNNDNGYILYVEITNYLKLARDYQAERNKKTTDNFLQKSTAEQCDEILAIALAQNHVLELKKFNNLNPKRYSWLYMLAFTAELDLAKSVAFLLVKMAITDQELLYIIGQSQTVSEQRKPLINPIKEIYAHAKTNDKKTFGLAVINYYKKINNLKNSFKNQLPNEIILKISEFQE